MMARRNQRLEQKLLSQSLRTRLFLCIANNNTRKKMNPVLISSLSSQRLQMIEELNPKKEKRLTFDFLSFNTPLPYGLEFQTSLETWTTAASISWLESGTTINLGTSFSVNFMKEKRENPEGNTRKIWLKPFWLKEFILRFLDSSF